MVDQTYNCWITGGYGALLYFGKIHQQMVWLGVYRMMYFPNLVNFDHKGGFIFGD